MKTSLSSPIFVVLFLTLFSLTALFTNAAANGVDNSRLRFDHLSITDGLSQVSVETIFEDHRGFMWFGTHDGLNRYDGYQFKQFRHDPQNTHSLSSSMITVIYEDSDNTLWIGTEGGGLNRYNSHTERFEHFRHDATNPNSLSHDHISAIYQDTKGVLWVGTAGGGLNQMNDDKTQFIRFKHQTSDSNSLSHNNVRAIAQDSQATLWVGTDDGLNRFNANTAQFDHFKHQPTNQQSLSHNAIYTILEDDAGSLWLGTYGGGLNRFDAKTQSFESFKHQAANANSLSDDKIWSMHQDNQGILWVGTDGGGLNRFDVDKRSFSRYTYQSTDPQSLSNNGVHSIYQSKKGFLWVGTLAGGINKIDSKQQQFGHIKHQSSVPASLSQDVVMSILEDSNKTLWVGTYDGGLNRSINSTDRPNDGFEHFKHNPNDPKSLANNSVWAIAQDAKNQLWIGTNKGVDKYNPATGQFSHYMHNEADETSLSDNWVDDILIDNQGTIWVGTRGGGLNRLDANQRRFKRFMHQPSNPHSLSAQSITSLLEDTNGNIWIGTWGGGLNKFDPNTEQFVHYRFDKNDATSLGHDIVMSIHQDTQGTLWVGTYGGGLNKFDPQTKGFARYQEKQGLANNTIYAIVDDHQGNLWLTHNQGLSKFNLKTQAFKHYDIQDGLQSNEFNAAFFRSNSGEIFFGGIHGLNRFYPETIKDDMTAPSLVFTNFFLFNQQVPVSSHSSDNSKIFTLPQAIGHTSQLNLDYRHSLVTFEFAALDYRSPMKNQYAYKLEGLDQNWIKADANIRRATYTNLPAGDYTLRIKASNADGYWNEQGRAIKIRVDPPWWLTKLAYALYLMSTVCIIFGIYHYRTRALVRRSNELEQRVAQRTATINRLMTQKERMFANVSHEFKTPLTLILTPLESLSLKLGMNDFERKVSMMKRNGQRLLRMIDQLLELSKLESTQLDKQKNYSLTKTLNRTLTEFQPLLDSKSILLNYQAGDDAVLSLINDSLEMVLNNLVSNAIKYTPAGGKITITTTLNDKNAVIVVADTGMGISLENQKIVFNRFTRANETHDENIPGAGIGLALVKELIDVNQGTITLTSELNLGSTFTVTLPLSENQDVTVETTSGLTIPTVIEVDNRADVLPTSTDPDFQTEKAQSSKPLLLLIDDNAEMLILLSDILGGIYNCITARNGEQGLENAKEQLPDLVVSDIMMPGISGFDVLKHLKNDPLTNHIPVVLLTAKSGAQSRMQGWTEKADGYLEKPFNADELKLRIANLLSVRSILRHRYQREFTDKHAIHVSLVETTNLENGLDAANQPFFDKTQQILENHYNDEALNVAFLADELAMSKRQLTRKMKSLLDYTPSEFIRSFRLNKATEKLKNGFSPSEVYHQVGFTSHSYFSQCFRAHYGCIPSSYASDK